jgi:hypothetical protein
MLSSIDRPDQNGAMISACDRKLPSDLERAIAHLMAISVSGPTADSLVRCVEGLAVLPARFISQVAVELARLPGLDGTPPARRTLKSLWRAPWTPLRLLEAEPRYAWLFIFHADGRVREAALERIPAAPTWPFEFSALALRLNDWAEPVRAAATAAAERTFPVTRADVVARAAVDLLMRIDSWGRWTQERAVLDATFARDDVIAALRRELEHGSSGPLGAVLRRTFRHAAMDQYLVGLATRAVAPSVRAIALEALISGRAVWAEGYAWEWVDKIYGDRRRVPRLASRSLTVQGSPEALIRTGLADRSATVRKVAATALIEARKDMPDADALVSILAQDPSAGVRMRADYMLRHPLSD